LDISPAEIELLAREDPKPIATFTVTSPGVERLTETPAAADTPPAIQCMLRGANVVWNNLATIPAAIRGGTGGGSQLSSQGGGPTLYRTSPEDEREGIYKDDRANVTNKWSAIIRIPVLDTYRKLGQFQTELDAATAFNHAKQEVTATGNYTGRWLKPRLPHQPSLTLNLSPEK
jgi:hypothetical protein